MNLFFHLILFIFLINLIQAAKWTGDFANFPSSWPLKSAGSSTNREIITDPVTGTGI